MSVCFFRWQTDYDEDGFVCAVRMIVKNYGLAPDATVRIEVLRTLSDNSTITYDSLYPLTSYSDTLMMVIRRKPWETNGFGDNHIQGYH
ncbi:MAG: hypothetical protein QM762_22685 [Chryseolinea sp.]